jgi:hypothetical protein
MKPLIFLSIVFCAFLNITTVAQGVKFGIKVGTDLHRINGQPFESGFTFGYHAGILSEISLNKTFSFQPEIYYSLVSVDSGSAFSDIYDFEKVPSLKFGYVNVPLLLNIRPVKTFSIQLGPQFGLLVNNNFALSSNAENAIKKGEMSFVGGVQLNFLKLAVYGRFIQGLSNLNEVSSNSDIWQQQTIHLGLAFRF